MILLQFIFNQLHSCVVFLGRDICVILAWASTCDFKINNYPLVLLHVVCENVQSM